MASKERVQQLANSLYTRKVAIDTLRSLNNGSSAAERFVLLSLLKKEMMAFDQIKNQLATEWNKRGELECNVRRMTIVYRDSDLHFAIKN